MRMLHAAAAAVVLCLAADAALGAVTFAQAQATAQAQVSGGFLIRARLEGKGKMERYGFYFLKEENVYEVEVSSNSGKVVKNKKVSQIAGGNEVDNPADGEGSGIDPNLVKALKARKAKIPYDQYIEKALKEYPGGTVSRIEATVKDGKLVVLIDVVVDGKTNRVTVDANSNKVVK